MEQINADLVIIGGGHAGIEAAHIASSYNLKIIILTIPNVLLGSPPCNPSVGGQGKGQVVREIDYLGGLMGKLADLAGIHYRTLNESKGYAVQSTRVQIDRELYPQAAEKHFSNLINVKIIREKVVKVIGNNGNFQITTELGSEIRCKKVVVTVGTFLNGKLHTGEEQTSGGRRGVTASPGLKNIFSEVKVGQNRFKTGTPPRLDRKSINFSQLETQPSDYQTRNFHWKNSTNQRKVSQVDCYLTRTNPKALKIIRDNKLKSPMYNGQISGVGARYCPSIEDKAYRYIDKDVHHIFIEPEGLNSSSMYPSGISTSLPKDVQQEFVNSIVGLENAEILQFGYAVEYDVLDTTELDLTLQHKTIHGLYFAGQVNGTSGYEEAAGQGLIAGANAALSLLNYEPLILSRYDSYIGVMIEDLCMNRRDEPYRLFTARSENRLYIREDNTALRMHSYRNKLNLNQEIDRHLEDFQTQYEILSKYVDECLPEEILKDPNIDPTVELSKILTSSNVYFNHDVVKVVGINKKYEGYIKRYQEQFEKIKKLDQQAIDWKKIIQSKNVSFECKSRVEQIKPSTFGQLKSIAGIRPATLAVVASNSI